MLFALFLLVLLGAAALAVDYANWLLTDRQLQNVSDHAALAGASVFDSDTLDTACGSNPALCGNARAQAWASLNQDLPLGLDDATIACLAAQDTPLGGWTNSSDQAGCAAHDFGGHTIWVTTPPPNNVDYEGVGGRYALNHAVVFARVNQPTRSYLAGVFGLSVRDRIGWATAGPLPTDFALQIFCRTAFDPSCGGSGQAALVIDGQGGIRLVRGDIGSNQSLKVTATNGGGVVVQSGNVFVVNGTCSNALWRCPNGPPSLGGISDGYNGQNAFAMPPQPVPQYASPVDDVGDNSANCSDPANSATHLCVPYRGAPGELPSGPGDWACTTDALLESPTLPLCGVPHDYDTAVGPPVNGTVRCDAVNVDDDGFLDGDVHHHMHPVDDIGASSFLGTAAGTNNIYEDIADFSTPKVEDTIPDHAWIYSKDGFSPTYEVTLGYGTPATVLGPGTLGDPDAGFLFLRWIPFRTVNNGQVDTGGVGANPVTITLQLQENGSPVSGVSDSVTLTSGGTGPFTVRELQFDRSKITDFNKLSLKFTVSTTKSNGANAVNNRGAGVSWAELETTHLSPFQPPRIPPGYYHSIRIPAGGCAVLDPTAATFTASTTGLKPYQKAGIYEFEWDKNSAAIDLGAGTFLIGDGVTLVFDPFTGATSGQPIDIGSNGALVLNTSLVPGTAPCTPTETESDMYNPSSIDPSDPGNTLSQLPYSSVCAAWAVESGSFAGIHPGKMLWTADDPANPGTSLGYCPPDPGLPSQCLGIDRSRYGFAGLPEDYRGITFFFRTNGWPPPAIGNRFQMSTCGSDQPGISFRGVLYAPYDDVKISGCNSFNSVGQILAWTAKFNGGSNFLDLDYPYESTSSPPYLLEPGLGQ